MAIALPFVLSVMCVGYGAVRVLRLHRCAGALGLLVPAGLAVLGIVATWASAVPLAPPVRGLVVAAAVAIAASAVVRDRTEITRAIVGKDKRASALLLLSVAVPIVSLGSVFWGVEVPLSPHDGAYHVEITDTLRAGQPFSQWYPPATPALFAAVLQLLPWVDTARGGFELGLALAVLAPLAVFGLALSVWSDARAAALSALFISLTYLFPYFPQIWSGWPLATSVLVMLGVWSASLEYLRQPAWQWAVAAGVLLGAIVVVHGTELYTLGLILLVLLLAGWRRIDWPLLARHLAMALPIAIGSALPYLPILLHWAGAGAAFNNGYEAGQALEDSTSSFLADSTFLVFLGGSLGMDVPLRVLLVAVGAWIALRCWTGRVVVGAAVLFLALGLMFALLQSMPLVRSVYAATFPWGMSYRTLIVVAIGQSVLAAAGAVAVVGWLRRWHAARRDGAARRLMGKAARLLAITWGLLALWALVFTLSITHVVVGFDEHDAAAMRWLRANASANALIANDSYADAGIWIPEKAGLQIVWPRAVLDPATELARRAVLANVGQLDRVRDAVCNLGVDYVYSGARVSDWDGRRFPMLEELRASSALREVFSSGGAAVFSVQVSC